MPGSDGVAYCVVGQEGILHDRAAGRLLVLNASARTIWALAQEGKGVAAIAATLCDTYAGVGLDHAREDVLACLRELRQLGMDIPPLQGELDDRGQE